MARRTARTASPPAIDDGADGNVMVAERPEADSPGEPETTMPVADAATPGWDAEGEHLMAVDRMAGLADSLALDSRSMVWDVRDFLLETIKARPKPWSATSQAEQRDIAAACEHAANELVRKVVEAVAANGVHPVRVLLTGVKLGSDMVITGKVKTYDVEEADQAVLALHHAIGKHVMLTRATTEDYRQEARDAGTDPDEPDFRFEADGDDPDPDGDDDDLDPAPE